MTNFIISFLNNINNIFQEFIPEGYMNHSDFIQQTITEAEQAKITIEL